MTTDQACAIARRYKARKRYWAKHSLYRATQNAWAARNREKIREYRK